MAIKVLLAFSNQVFSEGVARLLDDDRELDPHVLKSFKTPSETIDALKPEIVLLDFVTLYNTFTDIHSSDSTAFMLVDTFCGEENIISAVLSRRIAGILTSKTDSKLLRKAIKAVAGGEIWIDKRTVKNLLMGFNSTRKDPVEGVLSNREKEIATLVSSGFRNKEIALKLCISEQTVKSHLNRIFHKLGIQNRPQLIVYTLKRSGLTGNSSPLSAE